MEFGSQDSGKESRPELVWQTGYYIYLTLVWAISIQNRNGCDTFFFCAFQILFENYILSKESLDKESILLN